MLIIWGLVLAGLIVMIAAYRFIRLWLTWMDSKAPEEQQVRVEVKEQQNEKPSHYDMEQRVRKLAKNLNRPLVWSDLTDEERGLIEAEEARREEELRHGRPPDGYPENTCSGMRDPTQRL